MSALFLLSGANGFLDFTCFVNKPRINIEGNNGLFIGGYKSGDDTGATVTFGRESDTGTGTELPTSSTRGPHEHLPAIASIFKMPSTGGVSRIGAFYCEAQRVNIVKERIPAMIMASNSKLTMIILINYSYDS